MKPGSGDVCPALGMQMQVYLCDFKARLIYKVSSRSANPVAKGNHVLKKKRLLLGPKEITVKIAKN